MAYAYILYSAQLDKHYVSATPDELEQRIRRHNASHKGFTDRANDWVLMHAEPFDPSTSSGHRKLWVLLVKVTSTSSVTVQRWFSTSAGSVYHLSKPPSQ